MEAAYGKTGYFLLSLLQFTYPFLGKVSKLSASIWAPSSYYNLFKFNIDLVGIHVPS